MAKKHYKECLNMNKALTKRFMSLLPNEYQLGYNEILTRDSNRIFGETLNYFYTKCGQEDKVEIKENKEQMKKNMASNRRLPTSKIINLGRLLLRGVREQTHQGRRRTQYDDGCHCANKIVHT